MERTINRLWELPSRRDEVRQEGLRIPRRCPCRSSNPALAAGATSRGHRGSALPEERGLVAGSAGEDIAAAPTTEVRRGGEVIALL